MGMKHMKSREEIKNIYNLDDNKIKEMTKLLLFYCIFHYMEFNLIEDDEDKIIHEFCYRFDFPDFFKKYEVTCTNDFKKAEDELFKILILLDNYYEEKDVRGAILFWDETLEYYFNERQDNRRFLRISNVVSYPIFKELSESIINDIINQEKFKQLNIESYNYAVNAIIFFGVEQEFQEEGLLNEIDIKDFIRPQEDAIDTFIMQLNDLKINYDAEKKLAEEQLLQIIEGFITKWKNKYSIEQCNIDVPNLYYFMVLSAYGEGSGLWEEIGDELGKTSNYFEKIECFDLINKILEKYND